MAITGFGVTELNLIGSSGTPKIESPNNLNLNAVTVAISTNATVGGTATFDADIYVADNIRHKGDVDTYIEFTADQMRFIAGGKALIHAEEGTIDSVVINDGGNDLDFRVEGLNDEHLIFSDGSTDRVGIGTSAPTAKLDVNGDVYVGTSQATGVVLTSPNGTKYRLVVADNGTLSTTAV